MRTSLPLLLLFSACTADAPKSDGSDTATGETGDTSSEDSADGTGVDAMDVTAVVSEHVVTVVTVSWTTPSAVAGWVEFGEDETYGRVSVPVAAGTSHSVQLRGLWSDTTFHFRVVTEDAEGNTAESGDYTVTTGSLPAELPSFAVNGEVSAWIGQYQVIPVQGTTLTTVVVDDHGRIVWYHVFEGGPNLMRAMMTADREGFIFCLAGAQGSLQDGEIAWVSYDGYEERTVAFPYVDHDFTELPDGTWAGIVVTQEDGQTSTADRIVELNPDGTGERTVWNAWDDPNLARFNTGGSNWTHANGLDYDPVEDVYYISLKEIGTIVKVDRATGESLWYLNGSANTFAFSEGSEMPMMQHQFQKLDDGILIFDNGNPDVGSRVVQLALDEDALTADQVWEYRHDPVVYVFAKGDVHRFSDGSTQIVWSASGEIQNLDPDGNITWQLNTDLGYAMTFVQIVESLYGAG